MTLTLLIELKGEIDMNEPNDGPFTPHILLRRCPGDGTSHRQVVGHRPSLRKNPALTEPLP